jgi:hypothetical protein
VDQMTFVARECFSTFVWLCAALRRVESDKQTKVVGFHASVVMRKSKNPRKTFVDVCDDQKKA